MITLSFLSLQRHLYVRLLLFVGVLVEAFLGLSSDLRGQASTEFHVTMSPELESGPITGRLYVFITANTQRSPMQGPNWFQPEPFAALEVENMQPGQTIVIDDSADCFPKKISEWPKGEFRVQAILDHDFYYPSASDGPGNFFSSITKWRSDETLIVSLMLDQTVVEVPYKDTQRLKFIQRRSELLSQHFGREVIDRCAVILPESYDSEPNRRYPVYYEVTGFGGNLQSLNRRGPNPRRAGPEEVEFIQVILTGECKNGHHVYADSAANGPRGDALIHEMIPAIDSQFRSITHPDARFVGGHSSGGWSSLWLQVNYPDSFGAVYSTSPDPVDFRDFQGTDLYAQPPQSVYRDSQGNRRPLARRGAQVMLWYDDFCRMDQVLGKGGQMHSFDAVFSPLNTKGQPTRCWDMQTGIVNSEVVDHWKRYDISLLLAQNWGQLKEQLAGKIHIVMGDMDTFYLEGATRQLADRLKELGSDAKIEFIKDAGHNLPATVFQQQRQAMRERFLLKYNLDGNRK